MLKHLKKYLKRMWNSNWAQYAHKLRTEGEESELLSIVDLQS